METLSQSIVVETSPLISLLKVDRVDLLSVYAKPMVCLNHVVLEITRRHQEERLEAAMSGGLLAEVALDSLDLVLAYNKLRDDRPSLGPGECASIIYASAFKLPLIVTDRGGLNEALRRKVVCITTEAVVVHNIKAGHLSVEAADELLGQWKLLGEGVTKAASFQDLLT